MGDRTSLAHTHINIWTGPAWVGPKRPESCDFVWSEQITGGGDFFHSSLSRAELNFQKLYVSVIQEPPSSGYEQLDGLGPLSV